MNFSIQLSASEENTAVHMIICVIMAMVDLLLAVGERLLEQYSVSM